MRFSKFKGIIFDLDGTLITSSHVWSDIDIKFLAKRGLNVPENYFKAVSTMNFTAAAEYTNNLFNLNEKLRISLLSGMKWHMMNMPTIFLSRKAQKTSLTS